MSIAREINRSQKALERALDRPVFFWKDDGYPCTSTAATRTKDLTPGGFSLDADLHLFVRATLFGDTPPQPKQKLMFNSVVYRIAEVVTLPGNGLLKLVCLDANRKA